VPRDEIEPAACALRLDGVVVRYGDITALHGATFRVSAGSITGLIGRNGAGKSTTIRALAGLVRPTSGEVLVGGLTFEQAVDEIRGTVGYLLDTPALFPYLDAGETLAFIGECYGLSPAERARRAEDLLAFFGLGEMEHRLADELSTGMRKRLALAASMMHSPKLLVLDEPFESLDPLMVKNLKELLVRYARTGGSVLLSSHLIDAVEEICDDIVIMEQGRVLVADSTRNAVARAKRELQGRTLEDLYASVVDDGTAPELGWLGR
jgi:ABC-2 type transport system ATP-binding protein